jgi:hypothetical protein
MMAEAFFSDIAVTFFVFSLDSNVPFVSGDRLRCDEKTPSQSQN